MDDPSRKKMKHSDAQVHREIYLYIGTSIWLLTFFKTARPFLEGIWASWATNLQKKFPNSRFLPGTETHVKQIRAILDKTSTP
jgi:hypothetical protein